MEAQITAAIAVLAAIGFCVLQHVVVIRITHQRDELYNAVVAVAKGKATISMKDGEVEIKGV